MSSENNDEMVQTPVNNLSDRYVLTDFSKAIPCDAVFLKGWNCSVDEAMISGENERGYDKKKTTLTLRTGESLPVRKSALPLLARHTLMASAEVY